MGAAPLVVEVFVCFLLVLLLLHRHGNIFTSHPAVTASVLIAWFFSFVIVFIVPMDVSNTNFDQCVENCPINITINNGDCADCRRPASYLPQTVLEYFWNIVFWSSQLLTWAILPLLSSYVVAGEFTIRGKIKQSLIENAVIYGTLGALFGVLLIYIVASRNLSMDAIRVLCITASNTWGLLVLIFLMGYGLVQVPRAMWEKGNYSDTLTKRRFDVGKIKIELEEANEKLDMIIEEVRHINRIVSRSSELRPLVNIIIDKCPSLQSEDLANVDYDDYATRRDDNTISRSSLVTVHAKVKSTHANVHRCQVVWERTVNESLNLEDWIKMANTDMRGLSIQEKLNYISRVYVLPWYYKAIALLAAQVSLVIVWSEMLFSVKKPTLSICALVVKHIHSPAVIEVVCFLLISYMCLCAYYTIFKMRIFNYYYMAPAHQTDDYSLLFAATVLSRLTTPLSLNFLSLVHVDPRYNAELQTAFTTIMGSFEVIPFIAKGFNVYYPILIAIIGLATLFKLGSRCMAFLGFQMFVADDDVSLDMVEEGKALLSRERRLRERSETRQDNITRLREPRPAESHKVQSKSRDSTFDSDRARLLDSEEYDPTSSAIMSELNNTNQRKTSNKKPSGKQSLFDDV